DPQVGTRRALVSDECRRSVELKSDHPSGAPVEMPETFQPPTQTRPQMVRPGRSTWSTGAMTSACRPVHAPAAGPEQRADSPLPRRTQSPDLTARSSRGAGRLSVVEAHETVKILVT